LGVEVVDGRIIKKRKMERGEWKVWTCIKKRKVERGEWKVGTCILKSAPESESEK
jgi:hypothetical protein